VVGANPGELVPSAMSLRQATPERPPPDTQRSAEASPAGELRCLDKDVWRGQLTVSDSVLICSRTGGGWTIGTIVATSDTRVKVRYYSSRADGNMELTEKVLLRSSPDLRQYTATAHAKGSNAPAPAYHAQSHTHSKAPGSVQVSPPLHSRHPSWRSEAEGVYPVPVQPRQRTEDPQEARRWSASQSAVAQQAPTLNLPATPSLPSRPPVAKAFPGERIKASELQFGELLGTGGFGSVHRGWLRGEEVAIKKIHVDGLQVAQEQTADFEKEVGNLASLATLRHPCLIRFIGIAFEPPTLCIVTELASGGSLYALLHVQKAMLPEARTLRIILQITDGVAFLHGQRPPCVHRDLKSANVVLDSELNAKLCDFGLTESMEKTHLSRREAETGSPRYMAPEVFNPRSKLTEKLDMWSLGCLIIEVITQQLPHADCTTITQVAAKLLVHQQDPFEDTWGTGVQAELFHLLEPCFAREPAARPSAESLLQGLRCLPGLFAKSPRS